MQLQPSNEIGNRKHKEKLSGKAKIDLAIFASEKLKEFAKKFYQRLAIHNTLKRDSKDNPLPVIFTHPRDDRRYDAIARLFETDPKSCCAVCFDGEHILMAFNEDVEMETSLSPFIVKWAKQNLNFSMHMSSIAEMAVALKEKGIEPASGLFKGGRNVDVGLLRHSFLMSVLPFDMENPQVKGLIYNLLIRYMEFEKNSDADPSDVVDEFWEGFNDRYDLDESLKKQSNPLTKTQLNIFIRYLRDLVKVENFIAGLPLDHPILGGLLNKKQVLKIITEGPNGTHAEMRLFIHLLREKKDVSYIGISKLCCAHCNLALSTAGVEQIFKDPKNRNEKSINRGFHGIGYVWPLSAELQNNNNFMTNFLGPELLEIYNSLDEKNSVVHKKKGTIGNEKQLALEIIQYICSFKIGELQKHNFETPYLVGTKPLYPPSSVSETGDSLYMNGYYFEEEGILLSDQDITSGNISKDILDQLYKAMKVKILRSQEQDTEEEFYEGNELINKLLDAIGKESNDSKQLGDNIYITRGEVHHTISNSDNYYTADFINLLLHNFSLETLSIQAYSATDLDKIQEHFEKIKTSTKDYHFIPLNIAYNENESPHKNHWVGLIIDKKHQLIFYLDPAKKQEITTQLIEALNTNFGYTAEVILNPINFQKKEKQEGWLRHCGMYLIEIFKIFRQCIKRGQWISGPKVPNINIDENSAVLETVLSSIPCGDAEAAAEIRKTHIEDAYNTILAMDLEDLSEIQNAQFETFESLSSSSKYVPTKHESPASVYLRNTARLYTVNFSSNPQDQRGSFVISPNLFVPRGSLSKSEQSTTHENTQPTAPTTSPQQLLKGIFHSPVETVSSKNQRKLILSELNRISDLTPF